ncbi:ATP-dependent Clp protease proteolytic subunit-like isoform X3 [Phoenix dactylifera]|uniref:ATP-dependent Clp protease proteolytic subunit n=1 Tax=Phoenix dactylifera TaxID=42345 RepID=A0A8B9B2P5_PHODC|nr:ATP-dependent Clp protease proteolytic subunit-like isoform X3 [Phoenix dactylifera]
MASMSISTPLGFAVAPPGFRFPFAIRSQKLAQIRFLRLARPRRSLKLSRMDFSEKAKHLDASRWICFEMNGENEMIKPRVGTVCFGVAASQGAVLLAGGEKGMRHAMPNAHIMIHQPQSGCGGHVEDVRQQVKEAVQSRHALEFGLIDGVLVRNQSFPSDSFVDLAFRTWTSTYYNLQILMLGLSPFISSGGLLSSENQSLHSASSSSLQFNDLMHNCPRIYDC